MILWSEVEARQKEYERRAQDLEQTHSQGVPPQAATFDRWQWRAMNKLGSWLVEIGCRLQTHVETAQQMMRASQMTLESDPPSTRPCP